MIEPTQAASAATGARLLPTSSPARAASTTRATSFAGELARYVSAEANTVKAVPRPDNEQTTKVTGHPYARIENGSEKGMYLNQLGNSPREGAVFKLVERDDRVFHVYGSGKDKVVVEVKAKGATGSGSTGATGGTTTTTT